MKYTLHFTKMMDVGSLDQPLTGESRTSLCREVTGGQKRGPVKDVKGMLTCEEEETLWETASVLWKSDIMWQGTFYTGIQVLQEYVSRYQGEH